MIRVGQLFIVVAVVAILSGTATAAKNAQRDNRTTIILGYCQLELPLRNKAVADELKEVCETSVLEIFATLGQKINVTDGPITVRIVPSTEDMGDAAPMGIRPPKWSDAVAFPEHNLVVLALRNHIGSPISNLPQVLEHELSHLALRQALNGNPVPRWFSEGIAIHQSERSAFHRHWLVFAAARRNGLLALNEIEQYPEQASEVSLAYAQAADFLAWMLKEDGWFGIRVITRRVAAGESFEDAVQYALDRSLRALEREWRSKLVDRGRWLSLITSSGAIWGFAVVLFLVAYLVSRRRKKQKLASLQAEEDAVERVIATLDTLAEGKLPSAPKSTSLQRMPSKIRVDDDIHTLH